MSSRYDIDAFDRELRAVAGDSPGRPFLCNGSPFGCEIFLVGINPGTDTPFWCYWSPERGCDKEAWLDAYRKNHGGLRPTRARIERLCEAARPVRVLEANVFHVPSTREAELPKAQRTTAVFDFLLTSLQPRVVFVHGKSAVEHLERLTNASLARNAFTRAQYQGVEFDVMAGHHLSYQWSYAAVDQLGRALRERCASPNRLDA